MPTAMRAICPTPRPCPRELSSGRRARQASPTCDTPPTVPSVVLPVHVRARRHQRLRRRRVPLQRRIVQRRPPAENNMPLPRTRHSQALSAAQCNTNESHERRPCDAAPRTYPLLSLQCTSAFSANSAIAVSVCPFNDAKCSGINLH